MTWQLVLIRSLRECWGVCARGCVHKGLVGCRSVCFQASFFTYMNVYVSACIYEVHSFRCLVYTPMNERERNSYTGCMGAHESLSPFYISPQVATSPSEARGSTRYCKSVVWALKRKHKTPDTTAKHQHGQATRQHKITSAKRQGALRRLTMQLLSQMALFCL